MSGQGRHGDRFVDRAGDASGGTPARRPATDPADDRVGDFALAAGCAAFVTAFVPGIGEFVAAPTAVLAVVLGLVGIRRHETGRAARVAGAAVGTVLGLAAALALVIVFLATRVGP